MSSERRDALLVPVPKKGDLSCCDNWRDISLLDVMGKLFTRVLNDRLQLVVEETVSNSQYGFRAGRGCVDMIFCIRQLVERQLNIIPKCCCCLLTYVRPTTLYPEQLFGVHCGSMVCLMLWLSLYGPFMMKCLLQWQLEVESQSHSQFRMVYVRGVPLPLLCLSCTLGW